MDMMSLVIRCILYYYRVSLFVIVGFYWLPNHNSLQTLAESHM